MPEGRTRLGLILAVVIAAWIPASASAQEATLEVLCYTNGASVYVDDVEVATTPMLEFVFVEPGLHVVRVHKQGFLPWEEEIEFGEDDEVVLEVDLLPFGGLVAVVTAEAGAEVYVDEELVGTTPYEGEVPIGEHTFTVRRTHYEDWSTVETITAGEEYLIEATLIALPEETTTIVTESTPFYREWWVWSGAAVLIGGGIAAGILLSEDEEAAPVDILISLP